jgi:hypothetical protein
MKSKILFISVMALAAIITVSCSHRLTGTWNVDRYETINPAEQGVSVFNIGTFVFNNNGTGEKNLKYTILGITRDDSFPFKWTWEKDKYVTIESEGSDFSKTWIISESKKKSQKWKSTDGSNTIQVLEFSKR